MDGAARRRGEGGEREENISHCFALMYTHSLAHLKSFAAVSDSDIQCAPPPHSSPAPCLSCTHMEGERERNGSGGREGERDGLGGREGERDGLGGGRDGLGGRERGMG